MKIAIGVVTYNNNAQDLIRFIQAFQLACQDLPSDVSITLLCVDNGAPSKIPDWYSAAILLNSEGNIGYTRSINKLMKHAFDNLSVDAFITGNPDGAFHHSAITNFIQHSLRYPSALLEARQFPQEHPKIYDPMKLDTPWSSGCCIFIPRSLFHRIGPLDDEFFMYMEDVDYSWRARAAGFSVKFCPDVLYQHQVVDRGKNEVSVHQHFLSARYLGWKWGHRRFFKWAEKTLLNKKGFTPATLPKLPLKKPPFTSKQRSVTCFSKIFSFGDRRW